MKKILYLSLVALVLVTGCGKSEEEKQKELKENNKNIVTNIESLEVNGINEFKGLMVLDDNTMETELGLTQKDYENYISQVPYYLDSRLYIVIKPKEGKTDRIKRQIDLYISNITQRLEMEKNNIVTTYDEQGNEIKNPVDTTEIDSKIAMINNMAKEEYNGYLIYVSSNSNDKILEIIKNNLK